MLSKAFLTAAMASAAAAKVSRQVTTIFMPDQDLGAEALTMSPITVQSAATEYKLVCGSYQYGEVWPCGAASDSDLTYTWGPSTAHLVQSGTSMSREFNCNINPDSSSAECTVTHANTLLSRVYDASVDPYTMDDDAYEQYYRTRVNSYTTSTETGERTVTLTGTRYENAFHTAILAQDEDKPILAATGADSEAAAEAEETGSATKKGSAGTSGAAKETGKPVDESAAVSVRLSMGAVAAGALLAGVMML